MGEKPEPKYPASPWRGGPLCPDDLMRFYESLATAPMPAILHGAQEYIAKVAAEQARQLAAEEQAKGGSDE